MSAMRQRVLSFERASPTLDVPVLFVVEAIIVIVILKVLSKSFVLHYAINYVSLYNVTS